MPQVPYTGVQQVAPAFDATPRYTADVSPATFGVNVAQAIGHLGDVAEGAGTELFNRALAMQDLQNSTDAQKTSIDEAVHIGQLKNNFDTLENDARVKAYPKFIQDVQDAHSTFRSQLASPDAQRMFDVESRRNIASAVISAGASAGAAQKDYVVSTAQSHQALAAKQVSDDPTNDDLFTQKKAEITANSRQIAIAKGYPEGGDQEQLLNLTGTSAAVKERVTSLIRQDATKAYDVLQANHGDMTSTDYDRTLAQVKLGIANKSALDQTRDLATDPNAIKGGEPVRGLADREAAARSDFARLFPDDAEGQENAAKLTASRYLLQRGAIRDTQAGNLNTLTGIVNGDYSQGGPLPTTPDQVRAINPGAWDSATPQIHNQITAALAKNAKGDYPETPDTFNRYMYLRGLSVSPDEADRQKFLDTSLMNERIPRKYITVLNKQAESMIKSAGEPASVTSAMAQLRDAGIAPDVKDKDSTNAFRGGVSIALEQFAHDNSGRRPTPKEIRELGTQLLTPRPNPNAGWFGEANPPLYKLQVPDEEMSRTKSDLDAAGISMTDEQIRREQLRQAWIKLHPKATGGPSQ